MDDIFKYLDYRDYLRDHFHYNKSCHRFFSFRYVAGKTGLDASFYVKVLNKQKHIANSAIPILATFLKLSKRESSYFSTLVHFNKAKSTDQETFYLQKLLLLRKPVTTVLDNDLYEYLASWWNVALREELNIISFQEDYNDLASRFHPALSLQQAQRSIKLLQKLGLITSDGTGALRPTHDFVTTSGVDQIKAVRSYQKSALKLATRAIDTVPKELRDISTLTVSASRQCFETIRERINDLRREIIELVRKDKDFEEVYQINFQVFPLTRNKAKKNGP
ncbi:MAG: TIGR02147 family protein [Chitinispirillaceae bacterium]|nr:TIGR02147 family protein [Chitinispirillaceae bacterium]